MRPCPFRPVFSAFTLVCSLVAASASAQHSDSLFVSPREDGWTIQHRVRPGETIFSLSRRFHVPPSIFAESNGMTFDNGLREGSMVAVPLGAYNMERSQPKNQAESRPIYYCVRPEDDLFRISRRADVPRQTLRAWNRLPDDNLQPGQVMRVGWVLYDATTVPKATMPAPVIHPKATAPVVDTIAVKQPVVAPPVAAVDTVIVRKAVSGEEQSFREMVSAGVVFESENGPAVFFPSSSKNIIYAFHNIAPRGAILRVRNPVNGREVYAKVLGPLPQTKLYSKALIGLSAAARGKLGSQGDVRLWCEVTYPGY